MESAELTNDEAFRELSKIAVALMELPEDDYEQRLTLRQRRQEIKDLIAERPMSPEDVVSMRRELKGMRRQREAILDERPNIAAMNDGGQGGAGMAENQRLGWDYDEGTARNAIEERILDLERRIAETGH